MKKLGFGLMRLPLGPSGDDKDIDLEKMKEMADAYIKAGFSYFDTAYIYHRGASEKAFGTVIADRYPRESYVLTTKMPVWLCKTKEDYETIFAKQLDRTHAGYFDYYFLHAIGNPSMPEIDRLDGFGFLKKKKAEGLIRHIGFSFHGDAASLESILSAHPETELVQLQLNYADWESTTVEAHKCYDICRRHDVPVSVMEPVKGGALCSLPEEATKLMDSVTPGRTPASWALRFAGSLEGVLVVLSGMGTMEMLTENMELFDHFEPLNEKEQDVLKKTVEIYNESFAIKCTSCHYCTDGCPAKIAIPEYFNLYNSSVRYGYEPSMSNMYDGYARVGGKASDCIGCGQCESHCPQQLPIIENLKKVREMFEK